LLGKTREQGGHEWLCVYACVRAWCARVCVCVVCVCVCVVCDVCSGVWFACIDIHQESQSQGRSLLRREREVLTNMETLLKNIEAGNGSRIESFWA